MGFFDFLNPPAANIPPPQFQTYNPQNIGGADTGAFGGIGNLGGFNTYGQNLGQAGQITGNLVNNPFSSPFLTGAQYAGGMGQAGAAGAFGAGGGLMSLGGNIAGTAFDPQNDLYNRTLQQIQDQSRAGQAARGVLTSPYGAGLEDQATRNFNIDWQNQQLQRQIAGGGAANNLITSGAGLQAGAPGQYLTASGMPYATYQGIGSGQLGALNTYGQFGQSASQIPQQQIQDYMNYLGWGSNQMGQNNQAQQNLFKDQLDQSKLSSDQQSGIFGGLGKIAGGLWNTVLPSGGTVGGAALSGLGSILPIFSDARVKDDIEPVGELYDRTPVYSFRYKGDPTPRIGLMAQDVERRRPDAVTEIGGIKAVDYGKATEWSRGLAALSSFPGG